MSTPDAFKLLRGYAHARGEHLTTVARKLIGEPATRAEILAAMSEISATPS